MAKRRPKNPRTAAKRYREEENEESVSLNTILVIIVIVLLTVGATFFIVQNFNKPPTTAGNAPTAPQNPEAIKRAEEFAKQNPNDLNALLNLGDAYLDNGLDDQALKVFESVAQKDPKNTHALTHLGEISFKRGDPDQALALYDEVLKLDPNYELALYDKAYALQNAKQDWAAAIVAWKDFIRVMKTGPDVENANKFIAEAEKQLQASGGSQSSGTSTPATSGATSAAPPSSINE